MPDPALSTYQAFAPIYNEFNAANDYEMWLGRGLLPELRKHGLREPGRVLDVGCGTGRAFAPLLRRGWQIKGCDLSPAMLSRAAEEASAGEVELIEADMRELPRFGDFDLVLALNDPVNYLLGDDDLSLALIGMRANLVPEGLLLFDTNSNAIYGGQVGEVKEVRGAGFSWTWTSRGEVGPSIFEAEIAGDRLPESIRHVERYWSEGDVRAAAGRAGVELVAVLGMSESEGEVVLTAPADEERDYKIVFIGMSRDLA